MPGPPAPPEFKALSPTMRVDLMISDWRAALPIEMGPEEQERELYERAFSTYLEGDYGFGLWCWQECDRLTNALEGNLREVTRVLGPNRYFGFSHRRAVAERIPLDRVYRPRKGDMSTPRTDAFVLAPYQLLCVYEARAAAGDAKSKALLEIALGESEDRRRADPYMRYYQTFHEILSRPTADAAAPVPEAPPAAAKKTTARKPKRKN